MRHRSTFTPTTFPISSPSSSATVNDIVRQLKDRHGGGEEQDTGGNEGDESEEEEEAT